MKFDGIMFFLTLKSSNIQDQGTQILISLITCASTFTLDQFLHLLVFRDPLKAHLIGALLLAFDRFNKIVCCFKNYYAQPIELEIKCILLNYYL